MDGAGENAAKSRRVFIKGLRSDVTAADLTPRFTSFGDVVGVDVIRSADGTPKGFAYVDMMIKDAAFHRCMSVYGNAKWRGMTLSVAEARPSYMQRLQTEWQQDADRERIRAKRRYRKRRDGNQLAEGAVVTSEDAAQRDGWAVGRYGIGLPIMTIRRPGKKKMLRLDPKKVSTGIRRFKDEAPSVPLSGLTWNMPSRQRGERVSPTVQLEVDQAQLATTDAAAGTEALYDEADSEFEWGSGGEQDLSYAGNKNDDVRRAERAAAVKALRSEGEQAGAAKNIGVPTAEAQGQRQLQASLEAAKRASVHASLVDPEARAGRQVVFHDSSSEEDLEDIISSAKAERPRAYDSSGTEQESATETAPQPTDRSVKSIFGDSSGEEGEEGTDAGAQAADGDRFALKSQFEGEEGERLFRRQMRYKGDERFALTEAFREHDPAGVHDTDKAADEPQESRQTGNDGPGSELDEACLEEAQLTAERAAQLRMLAKLGIKSVTPQSTRQQFEKEEARKAMTHLQGARYDPTASNAADLEIQPKPRRQVDEAPLEGEVVDRKMTHETEAPKVSKERFIAINPDLKEAIKPASGDWKSMEQVSSFSFFGGPTPAASEGQDPAAAAQADAQPSDIPSVASTFSFSSSAVDDTTTSAIAATTINTKEVVKWVDRPPFRFFFAPDELVAEARSGEGLFLVRERTVEDIEAEWLSVRSELHEKFKKQHKSAVRRAGKQRKRSGGGGRR